MIQTRKETTKERLPFWRRLKISELGLRIVFSGITLCAGVAYIVLTTTVATNGLQVKDLSDRLDSLGSRQAELQAEADRLQSFQHLEAVTKRLDLVRVSKVDVVGSPTGSVAIR